MGGGVTAVNLRIYRLLKRQHPSERICKHGEGGVSGVKLGGQKRHLQWLEPFQCWFLMDVL